MIVFLIYFGVTEYYSLRGAHFVWNFCYFLFCCVCFVILYRLVCCFYQCRGSLLSKSGQWCLLGD